MSPYQTPSTPHELRQKLYLLIDKLSDRSTFTQASNELNYVAKSLPLDLIPTFLTCILTVDSSLKSPVRVHCLNLVSILARTHSSSVLSPHLSKIVNSILRRLRENDSAVRTACSAAVAALSPHNPAMVIETLMNCVSTEQELGAQTGGCLCLKSAIDATLVEYGDVDELMRKVLIKILKLLKTEGFKAKSGLLGVMASLISFNHGNVVNGGGLGRSVVEVAVEMLSSDDWGARKGGAEVLQMVSEFGNVEFVAEFKRFVVGSLESRRFDKVKVTRETMNRAWEAWKEIPGDPDEVSSLPRSNSSVSKGYSTGGGGGGGGGGSSPPLPRRSSYAGPEAYKPKKTMNKSRSSAFDVPTASISGHEMPQRKQTLSKSRSSISDDSSITDSSSISKSSCDFGFETPQSKKQTSKNYYRKSRKSLDWKIEVAVPTASSITYENKTELQDKTAEVTTTSSSERRSNFLRSSEERVQKTGSRNRAQVNPVVEEDDEVGESTAESAELSLIRTQLSQIERQQSDLLELVQRFMGKSQNGIDSLQTRVSGLEKALDEISHDLAVQTGRIPNNGSTGNTCCPSTEFLSPKFWRRTEGKSSNSRPSYFNSPESLHMDGYRVSEQNDGKYTDMRGNFEGNVAKSVKLINQTSQKGRICSPRSFDNASTNGFKSSVVKGA